MDSNRDNLDYEVLGYKVKMKPGHSSAEANPDSVVELVREEANKILDRAPNLDRGQVALLVALKLANEKLVLESEYRENIDKLHATAGDALQFIEEVAPTTV